MKMIMPGAILLATSIPVSAEVTVATYINSEQKHAVQIARVEPTFCFLIVTVQHVDVTDAELSQIWMSEENPQATPQEAYNISAPEWCKTQ